MVMMIAFGNHMRLSCILLVKGLGYFSAVTDQWLCLVPVSAEKKFSKIVESSYSHSKRLASTLDL